jgi:hypothetical protein
MPTPFQLTPRALGDLGDIWDSIAEDNVDTANRVESAIFVGLPPFSQAPSARLQTNRDYFFTGSVLDGNPISQLRSDLPPRHQAVAGHCGAPWEEEYQSSS